MSTTLTATPPAARALARRLQVQYFLVFAPFAIVTTYQNLHFKRLGFSDSQIGSLNAIAAILAVISPPLWGYVTDRLGEKRAPLAILLITSGALYPFFLGTRSFLAAAIFQGAFSFCFAPCVALTDALVLEQLPRAGGDYARLRLWGSMGFICTLLAFGLFLGGGPLARAGAQGSLTATFIAFALVRLVNTAWVLRLPPGEPVAPGAALGGEVRALLRSRTLILFFMAMLLGMTALRAYYVFFSIYLDGLGVADSWKGVFWSLGVAAEVGFMLVAGRLLPRLGVKWMLAIGLAGGALRLLLFSFSLPIAMVALAQGLHALAFGATHIATVTFINDTVPDRLRASGQTFYAAVVTGLGGAVGSRLSGDLAQAFGIGGAFRLCALLAGVAVLVVLLLPGRKALSANHHAGGA